MNETISYFQHEAILARMERTQSRLTAITISAVILSALLIFLQFRQQHKE